MIKIMNNIVELNATNFKQEVLQAASPVVVDFYATWCGPCKMLAPMLEQLAGELNSRVKFAKADVDDMKDVAAYYDVTGVPTLMLFNDGKNVDKMVGMTSARQLRTWLENATEPTKA